MGCPIARPKRAAGIYPAISRRSERVSDPLPRAPTETVRGWKGLRPVRLHPRREADRYPLCDGQTTLYHVQVFFHYVQISFGHIQILLHFCLLYPKVNYAARPKTESPGHAQTCLCLREDWPWFPLPTAWPLRTTP